MLKDEFRAKSDKIFDILKNWVCKFLNVHGRI